MQSVVIMKAHQWSSQLEDFVVKIQTDCLAQSIDFFIIMHDEDFMLISEIASPEIRNCVLQVTRQDIESVYPSGFIDMWLSNHWMLMWFYRRFPQYDYYWSMEHDVRISGDSTEIWSTPSDSDFLYVMGNMRNPNNKWNHLYTSSLEKPLDLSTMYHGYLQLARYSKPSLRYLDDCFEKGENGQDEMIVFSLMRRGGFSMSSQLLHPLIGGTWTSDAVYSSYNREEYEASMEMLRIFHPVK